MTSTPSVPQYMPSLCQNIDVSRHALVYRYIHDRANRMVENTTIRSYKCVCDSQMQRPGVIILLFEKKQTRVWEDECVRAPLLFLYNILLNSEYKFLWVARWCVREVPRDRFNASEKKTSLELATRLFLSNAPLTVRYVYDGASYCTYTAVLPPFRFIGLNSKISPTKMVSGGIFFVVCKST